MLEALPSSYTEAQQTGALLFFTGRPCRRGHISTRHKWGGCVECCKERDASRDKSEVARQAKERRAKDPTSHRAAVKRARERNPEETRARVEKWRSENPDHLRAYRKKYYAANADGLREKRVNDYRARPEFWADAHRRWRRNNPETAKANSHRRRARKLAAPGHFTGRDIKEIRAAQRGRCAHCREKKKLTIDHIIALAKGGSNDRRNIQLLCFSCNCAKKDRDPIDFARAAGRLL